VDAVNIGLRLLLRLMFHRPLVIVLLVIVYLTGAFLVFVVDSDKRAVVIATIGAFATVGLSSVLTERIARFSLVAGSLGLPGHAFHMRQVQCWFLALFVAVPAAAAALMGMAPLTAAALFSAATAAGVVLSTYGAIWIVVVPIVARIRSVESWIQSPVVQTLAIAASGWLFWRWFALAARAERAGGFMPALLADADHERPEPQAENKQQAQFNEAAGLDGRRMPATLLAAGLGYPAGTSWRGVLYGSLTAVVMLFAWRLYRGPRPDIAGYAIVTAACCLALVGRLQAILHRWMRTPIEQSLLRLAPRWPEERAIKRAVLKTLLMVQRGGAAAWTAISVVALTVGWIGTSDLLIGGLGVLGTSLAFTGSVLATLARRRVREMNLSTVALVLTVAIGTTLVLFGDPMGSSHVAIGLVMMAAPPLLALAWYLGAPLRLPLNVDARALKSSL
jgi:hypothetical protein